MNKKLLRKKLALMLANLKKKRKYYCEVEYLETTKQQSDSSSTNAAAYIDTGIIPNNNTRMECRMQFTTLISGNSKEALNGTTGAESAPRFAWGFASVSPYTNFYFGLGAQNLTTSVTRDTNVHTFVLDAKNKTWSIDNTTGSFTSSGSLNGTRSIYLFARHTTAEYANKPCNAKIYFCKIYDNETIVRDFIPVLDWNYTPCMYDKITGQLFYTKGEKQFLYGREIHYVDYLESTGTQYIDTGIQPTDDYGYRIRNTYTAGGGEQCAIGCMDSGNRFVGVYTSGNANSISGAWGSYVGFLPNYPWTTGTILDVEVNYKNSRKMIVGGTELKDISDVHISGTISNTIYLFARNYGGTITKMQGNIYGIEITNGQTVVADFIPMVDEHGVGAMFDRVSHTIYDNAGTGSFAYPPVELEYLESTGTQYIDMGIGVKDNTVFKAIFSVASEGTGYSYFGARNSSNERFQIVNSIGIGAGYYIANNVYPIADKKYEIEMHANGDMYLDGVKRNASTGTFSQVSFERSLWLFGTNYYNSSVPPGASTFWKAQVLEGDTIVRDFIPAFKDGVAGMLDKVNNVFYNNAGTGTFNAGKIVESIYE